MPPLSMSPGTVLDGRYRLEVLLSEHDEARFWRATDTVLARSVAVHVVASDDPRAEKVLDAARRSAAVSEPHFLRVLDCDDVDGVTWVINEWGEGTSLDVMLAQGSLPPMRAAWLTREVAEAIAAAHAKGLVHGRLNPEAVLVTDSGTVKIIGFVVNAAFDRPRAVDSPYGAIGEREADVVDLAGILYAALTGRWPGVAPSALPRAPREGNRPLRPRQVRAGVPRTLDTICDRVLHKEAAQHVMPIETALEIAAALSDFVGDPAAVAPVDVPSMHDDPEAPVLEAVAVPPVPDADADPDVEPVETPAPADPTPDVEPVETPAPADPTPDVEPVETPAPADPTPDVEPVETPAPADPTQSPPPDPPPPDDPEATMAAPPPFSPSGIEFLELDEWEPAAPPPPFEQPADRPLFADAERRIPPGAPAAPPGGQDPGSQAWAFDDDPGSYGDQYPGQYPEPRRRRSGWLILLIVVMTAALAGVMYLVYRDTLDSPGTGSSNGSPSPGASATSSTTSSATSSATSGPVVTGSRLRIAAVGDFDPEGDPPAENPSQTERVDDGDPATAWHTEVYTTSVFGGLKSGVGVVVDLGRVRAVGSVEVTLLGAPTGVELWATPPDASDAPAELADAQRVGGLTSTGTDAVIRPEGALRSRYLIVWLTKLPASGSGYQGQIAEITVRS